jgi:hypothetical protein
MSAVAGGNDQDALLTEVQAADLLTLSVRTLQAWRARGFGPPYVRAGRAVRYRRRDLLNWTEAHVVVHSDERRITPGPPSGGPSIRDSGRAHVKAILSALTGRHPNG